MANLNDPSPNVRIRGLGKLRNGPALSPDQLSTVVNLLGDPSMEVRQATVTLLRKLEQANSALVPLLMERAEDKNYLMRIGVVTILGPEISKQEPENRLPRDGCAQGFGCTCPYRIGVCA